MPSELKSETARINGAKSRGPTTEAGKATSSQNAIKHGMTARNTYILECENTNEYKEFLAQHIAIHQPATPPEKELIEQMAIARWRIRRFVSAETVLIDCEIVRNRDKVEKEFDTLACGVHVAMAIRSLADESRCLSLMSRYEARHQRCHDKAYAALRELQQSRVPVVPPPAASPAQPDPASPAPDPAASPVPEPPSTPAYSSSVSAGADPTPHNPSVSAGSFADPEILPNEPTATPDFSPDIHRCPPVPSAESENSEDHEG